MTSPSFSQPALRSPSGFSTKSNDSGKSRLFVPLSHHGLPKTPASTSFRSHRFSSNTPPKLPVTPRSLSDSPLATPMSPPPPMSARSISTFIDSEPATPAYSPGMSSGYGNSQIMLFSPVPSNPGSPPEPEWQMLEPGRSRSNTFTSTSKTKELLPVPSTAFRARSSSPAPPRSTTSDAYTHKLPPKEEEAVEAEAEAAPEAKAKEEETTTTLAAPLEKLATRVKLMLRRKTLASERRAEKRRREYYQLDRMETVHWTEM